MGGRRQSRIPVRRRCPLLFAVGSTVNFFASADDHLHPAHGNRVDRSASRRPPRRRRPLLSPRSTQRPARLRPGHSDQPMARLRSAFRRDTWCRVVAGHRGPSTKPDPSAVMVGDCPRTVRWSWDGHVTAEPQPTPRPAKPRLLRTSPRHVLAARAMVVGCILLAGLVDVLCFNWAGTKSGDRSRPTMQAPAPADVPRRWDSRIRLPQLPGGWTPNSGVAAASRTGERTRYRSCRNATQSGFISLTGEISELDSEQRRRGQAVGLHPPVDVPDGDGRRGAAPVGSVFTTVRTKRCRRAYGRRLTDRAGPPSGTGAGSRSVPHAGARRRNRSLVAPLKRGTKNEPRLKLCLVALR